MAVPVQPPATGVTRYTTVPAELVVAVSTSLTLVVVPEAVAPEALVEELVHENVVPATLLDHDIGALLPEQIVCDPGDDVAVGIGFTLTVINAPGPTQPAGDVAVAV